MRLLFGGITWFAVSAGAAFGAESGFFGCRPPAHHPPGDYGNHRALLSVPGALSERPLLHVIQHIPSLEFRRLTTEESKPYAATAPLWSLQPPATAFRDVRRADVWVRPLGSNAPGSHPDWIEGLEVAARVASAAGTAWWAVQMRDDPRSLNGTDAIRVDPIEAGGAALAIAIVSLSVTEPGHSASIDTTRRLAIDFRAPVPRLLAILDCSWSDTRQSCTGGYGHKDTTFWNGNSIDCTWEAARDRFLCRSIEYAGTDWGGRVWSSSFDLESRSRVPLPPFEAAGVAERATAAKAGPAAGDTLPMRFGDVGTLTPLAMVPSRVPGRSLRLFAARGADLDFDPRFFLLVIDAAGGPKLEELKLHDPDPRGPDADHALEGVAPGFTADGNHPTFTVAPVPDASPDVHLFQVVATEGAGHGLYWVGVEDREPPIAHAVRLASDVAYPFCGGRTHPATAVAVKRLADGGGVGVQLDMEPAYFDLYDSLDREVDGQVIERKCPWTVRVAWQPGRGFEYRDDLTPCARSTEPRPIQIRPDGSIASAPPEEP